MNWIDVALSVVFALPLAAPFSFALWAIREQPQGLRGEPPVSMLESDEFRRWYFDKGQYHEQA